MKYFLLSLVLIGLVGCATPRERYIDEQKQWLEFHRNMRNEREVKYFRERLQYALTQPDDWIPPQGQYDGRKIYEKWW